MPWEEKTVEEARKEFVRRVLAKEASKSALCREYGISRVTGDKWLKRYEQGLAMEDQSRAPFHTPNKISRDVEEHIIEMRKKEPAIGAKKIHQMMINDGKEPPAISTINAVLKRNNMISKQASQAAQHYIRFQKEEPNEMWQADFKGHFAMRNNIRCHPLSIIDDCSRYCLCCDAKENEQQESARESFINTFRTYGMPKSILCDNGSPWGNSQSTSITKFEVWLMELGILTLHIRMKYPQCQGKVERFNGSYKRERLNFYIPRDIDDAQRSREEYQNFYNNVRPHESLGMDVPAKHYKSSTREYPEKITPWEYESGGELRHIKSSGYLTFRGQGYYLSEGMGEKDVMIFPDKENDGLYDIVFREYIVAKLSLHDNSIRSRKVLLRYNDPRSFV